MVRTGSAGGCVCVCVWVWVPLSDSEPRPEWSGVVCESAFVSVCVVVACVPELSDPSSLPPRTMTNAARSTATAATTSPSRAPDESPPPSLP